MLIALMISLGFLNTQIILQETVILHIYVDKQQQSLNIQTIKDTNLIE